MTATDRPGGEGLARRVRPYAIVGGRTRPSTEIPVETLARTTAEGAAEVPRLSLERREIASLCGSPMSIAEISAYVSVPLGVARVLVGDMAAEGLLQCQVPTSAGIDRPDIQILERVPHGLQRL